MLFSTNSRPWGGERPVDARDVVGGLEAMPQHPDRDRGIGREATREQPIEHVGRAGHEPVRLDILDRERPHARTDVDADHAAAVARYQFLGQPPDAAAVVDDDRVGGQGDGFGDQTGDIRGLDLPAFVGQRAFAGQNDLARLLGSLDIEDFGEIR
jgi:hypothetical protein